MSLTVPTEIAERELRSLLEQLRLGETATLVSSEGTPEALLVSLKSSAGRPQLMSDWDTRWDALAQKVSQAWKGEKSAVEILAEMRR
jgi:hypothetical protein